LEGVYLTKNKMNPEILFNVVNAIAMVAWGLLIVMPGAAITRIFIRSGIVILLLAAIYATLIVAYFDPKVMQDFSSLSGVMHLFTDPMGVVAGWTHYLVFDLFVGMWITNDALKAGVNRWLVLPCQIFAFMFGPIGFLLYYGVRFFVTKSLKVNLFAEQ
jgi:hypothetical protein